MGVGMSLVETGAGEAAKIGVSDVVRASAAIVANETARNAEEINPSLIDIRDSFGSCWPTGYRIVARLELIDVKCQLSRAPRLLAQVWQHASQSVVAKNKMMHERGGHMECRQDHENIGQDLVHFLDVVREGLISDPWRGDLAQPE